MGGVTFPPTTRSAKPQVRLLDARVGGLDAEGLHAWARGLTAPTGAPWVTRSYCYPYALVGWHDEPIGIDIEKIGPCDPAFADLICTPDERSDAMGSTDQDRYLTSLWSSKEALSKALGDPLRYEPSRLESPVRWRDRRSGPWRATQLIVAPDHVAWLCWRTTTRVSGRARDRQFPIGPAMSATSNWPVSRGTTETQNETLTHETVACG
jgi:phosphopantetheinyl transferase (holo-ACP synthase)